MAMKGWLLRATVEVARIRGREDRKADFIVGFGEIVSLAVKVRCKSGMLWRLFTCLEFLFESGNK